MLFANKQILQIPTVDTGSNPSQAIIQFVISKFPLIYEILVPNIPYLSLVLNFYKLMTRKSLLGMKHISGMGRLHVANNVSSLK